MNEQFFRRHLPHLHFDEGVYFITSRLYNPVRINSDINKSLTRTKTNTATEAFKNEFIIYDDCLHKGVSKIDYLKNNEIAEILVNEFHLLDAKDYNLIAYTILSNHFHLLFELLKGSNSISKIMKSIKGRSSLLINKKLNRTGKLWQDESYDRWVRNDVELYFVIKYILENPVKAGLVSNWQDWQFTFCKKEYLVL